MSGEVRAALRRVDRPTLFLALLLGALGLVAIASAGGDKATELWTGQAKFFAFGVALMAPVALMPYQRMLKYAWPAYLALVVCLALVFFVGPTINGSQRWLRFGFNFQPSEPLKVVLVLLLARRFRFGRPMRSWRDWAPALAIVAVPLVMVARQPDLGTSLLFLPTGLAVLFAAGLPWRALGALALLGLLLGVVTFFFLLKPYQQERIRSTVFRERLADYERAREGYQLGQSILAIKSGGVLGQGVGRGTITQSGRLPYAYSDFAFAAVAEEAGFFGGAAVLLLVLLLVLSIFRVGLLTRDPGGRLLCVGIGTLIAVQTAVNAGVALGVVPTTGMPMPFVSHGGSSLVTFLVAVACVLSVSVHRVTVLTGSGDDR